MTVPALEVEGLVKYFGGLPATRNVSFSVPQGERRLLLGPNGAGKTTLFNLIAGDLKPDKGSIRMFGQNITRLKNHQRVQNGLGRTFQVITLFDKETLLHNVTLAMLGLSNKRWNPLQPLSRARESFMARAHEVLAAVGLEHLANRSLSQTSYGERRRLEIAMAISQRPRVLLLDEPLAGLSREERSDVQTLLENVPREMTMVIIEHDMDVALSLAEKITALHYGEVILEGTREEVVEDPRIKEVYLGG